MSTASALKPHSGPLSTGDGASAGMVGEALVSYGADSLAQLMAKAFGRVIEDNLAGDKAPNSIRIFHSSAGGANGANGASGIRLDTDTAALVASRGLKVRAVEDWLAVAKLPKKGFYDGLRLSPSTLSRKGREETLDAAVTERLVRQSELMVKAAEVFGEGAAIWIMKAHPLLGGATPMDTASNEYGGIKVREILNAIEHGGVV